MARVIETCCHAVHPGAFENLRSTVALGVLLNAASEPVVVTVVAVAHTFNRSIREAERQVGSL